MSYEKTEWKDQDVENPRTYSVKENLDGTITLFDAFGEITELGTPVNAENMNKIEEGIANSVQKTGDETISGIKTLDNNGRLLLLDNASRGITFRSTAYDVKDKQSQQYYGILVFQDKNNYEVGRIDNWNSSNNTQLARMGVRNKNGVWSFLQTYVDDEGNANAIAPTPIDSSNSTAIATTAWVRANASSIIESGSNYIKFSDKTLICWGRISGTSGTASTFTITFPKPFADKNWCLSFTPIQGSWDYGWYVEESSIETTGCIIKSRNGSTSGMYMVIGKGV